MGKRRHELLAMALCAAMIATAAHAQAGDENERFADIIHADLPLFGGETPDKFPQPFTDAGTGAPGCMSRIAFGDWAMRAEGETGDEDAEWFSVANYGVFHCFAVVGSATDREGLKDADARPSFFVNLGMSGGAELWALQLGARPGSDYILLSRRPEEGMISEFAVLQRRCPKQNIRDAGTLSILITRYCAINSRAGLRRLARAMMKLEPLGILTLVEASG